MLKASIAPHEVEKLSACGWTEAYFPSSSDWSAFAAALGTPHPSRLGGPLIDKLVPTAGRHARDGTMSASLGFEKFPLHTDGAYFRTPPRFIILRLASGAQSARATLVCDVASLALTAEERHVLAREVWIVRGGGRSFLSSILNDSLFHARTVVRDDQFCMTPAG